MHVASHIRSGHCREASPGQIKKFKEDYFYPTPKKLVHRSSFYGKRKSNENSDQSHRIKNTNETTTKSDASKRTKIDDTDEVEVLEEMISDSDQIIDDVQYVMINETQQNSSDNADVIVEKTNRNTFKIKTISTTKEDKFIAAVYPQYSNMTKLQLIENLLEIKKENDLLKSKCSNYEDSINRLLND